MKEAKLTITIFDNVVCYNTDTRIGTSTKFERLTTYCKESEKLDGLRVSDFTASVIDKYAPQFAYIGVRKAWTRSCNPTLERIMSEIVHNAPARNDGIVSFESDCAIRYNNGSHAVTVKKRHKYRMVKYFSTETVDMQYFSSLAMVEHVNMRPYLLTTWKKIPYTKKVTKSHRHEVKFYNTIERTRYAKERDASIQIHSDSDGEDIIQETALAMIELVHSGLVNCPSDFWHYQQYIYKAIRRYLYHTVQHNSLTDMMKLTEPDKAEAKKIAEAKKRIEEKGNEIKCKPTMNNTDNVFKAVWNRLSYEEVKNFFIGKIPAQANELHWIAIFKGCILNDIPVRDMADRLGVSHVMVVKTIGKIRKIMDCETVRDMLTA